MSRGVSVVKTSRIALFALILSAPLGALSGQPGSSAQSGGSNGTASEQQASTQQSTAPAAEERRICRRVETTGTRTGPQRVCLTAEQWRRADD